RSGSTGSSDGIWTVGDGSAMTEDSAAISSEGVRVRQRQRGRPAAPAVRYAAAMALQERDFFTERPETRPTPLTCPRCRRRHEYQLRWIRRIKKDRIPAGATERDRALYAKLRDYLIRVDDVVNCL